MTKKTKKPGKEKPAASEELKPKKSKTEYVRYHSFHLTKRIKGESFTGSFRLMRQAFVMIGKNWKHFGGVVFWYILLTITLVQGFQTLTTINETKDGLSEALSGDWSEIAVSASMFIYFLGSAGDTTNATAATYQAMLALVFSLVFIWSLRQLYAKEKIRIRDSFYNGMAPLVPFVLVLLVVALQLIPMVAGGTLFSTIFANGVATEPIEIALWAAIFFILALVTLYMLASSLFALYIVTLPGMTPMAALRSARELVRHRRWAVMRKIVFLPIALVVIAGVLTIPLFLLVPSIAVWVLLAISMLLLPVAHSYMYALYRALL